MSKFKIFHAEVAGGNKAFEERVNKFLKSHKIIDVKQKISSQKASNWCGYAISQILSYIIEYE